VETSNWAMDFYSVAALVPATVKRCAGMLTAWRSKADLLAARNGLAGSPNALQKTSIVGERGSPVRQSHR
jgi:hypothetical protein